MIKILSRLLQKQVRGQSLAETAVFLPVIMIMLAGVVEVSNILVTQNRLSAAARAATGYAATTFTGEEWNQVGVWSTEMADVARNNVTETLDMNPDLWDIWTVKATVNKYGDDFSEWVPIHAFGNYQVLTNEQWNASDIKGDVLAKLRQSGDGMAQNLQIVATVAYHDRQSILGLKSFRLGPLFRVRGLTVMRLNSTPTLTACGLFPITIYEDNLSLYPEGTSAAAMLPGGKAYDPDISAGGWQPATPGPYPDGAKGGRTLRDANRGDIFEARQVQDNPAALGAFGWVTWDGALDSNALEASMTYPGNLSMYPTPPSPLVNYANPDNPDDLVPDIDDYVQGTTGNMNKTTLRTLLDGYATGDTLLQVVAYRYATPAGGANFNYRVSGFPIIKLRAYKNTTDDKRILIEFVEWSDKCIGQIK